MRADTRYLTTEEIAKHWQLTPWTVRELAKQGRIQGAVKPGRDWRFPVDACLTPQRSAAPLGEPSREDALALIRRLR